MRLSLYILILGLGLQACGNSSPAPAGPGPANMDDLVKYIVTTESDRAIVTSHASPFGGQALKRTVINSADDLQRIGSVSKHARLAIRFSKTATPAQMRQFAQYGKQALKNPRNSAILGALLATGVVLGYELLEDESPNNINGIPLSPGTGVSYASIGQPTSKEEVIKGLKSFKIPKQTLDAVSAELSLATPDQQNAIARSLSLSRDEVKTATDAITKTFRPAISSEEARIDNVSFSRVFRNGQIYQNILISGQITNQTRTIVKASFYNAAGDPLKEANGTKAIEVQQELMGVISRQSFHVFPGNTPLTLSLPFGDLTASSAGNVYKCRVEVYHKNSGKLLAASAVQPIS